VAFSLAAAAAMDVPVVEKESSAAYFDSKHDIITTDGVWGSHT